MRLQLNLNQYYDGLNLSQVNSIFSQFMDLKVKIEELKRILNKPKEKRSIVWNAALSVYSESVYERVQMINLFMLSVGKQEIFSIGHSIEDTDFVAIIEKYEYLMSKPN